MGGAPWHQWEAWHQITTIDPLQSTASQQTLQAMVRVVSHQDLIRCSHQTILTLTVPTLLVCLLQPTINLPYTPMGTSPQYIKLMTMLLTKVPVVATTKVQSILLLACLGTVQLMWTLLEIIHQHTTQAMVEVAAQSILQVCPSRAPHIVHHSNRVTIQLAIHPLVIIQVTVQPIHPLHPTITTSVLLILQHLRPMEQHHKDIRPEPLQDIQLTLETVVIVKVVRLNLFTTLVLCISLHLQPTIQLALLMKWPVLPTTTQHRQLATAVLSRRKRVMKKKKKTRKYDHCMKKWFLIDWR